MTTTRKVITLVCALLLALLAIYSLVTGHGAPYGPEDPYRWCLQSNRPAIECAALKPAGGQK